MFDDDNDDAEAKRHHRSIYEQIDHDIAQTYAFRQRFVFRKEKMTQMKGIASQQTTHDIPAMALPPRVTIISHQFHFRSNATEKKQ